jgi:hypothetical protein
MAVATRTMTDEQRKSVALEYLKAFDNAGTTSTGGSILDLFAEDAQVMFPTWGLASGKEQIGHQPRRAQGRPLAGRRPAGPRSAKMSASPPRWRPSPGHGPTRRSSGRTTRWRVSCGGPCPRRAADAAPPKRWPVARPKKSPGPPDEQGRRPSPGHAPTLGTHATMPAVLSA